MMRYRDGRRSLCLSSQSGCPLTCTFCATGSMKFGRNLTASEILDQALHFRRIEPVDHVVYMGMGEPMMNIDAVLAASRRLPDVGVSHRHTTVSTVGWVPGIDRLAAEPEPIRLAFSLHAPEDALRTRDHAGERALPAGEGARGVPPLERGQAPSGVHRVRDARGRERPLRPGGAARRAARPARLQGQPHPVQPDRLGVRGVRAARRSARSATRSRSTGSARRCA